MNRVRTWWTIAETIAAGLSRPPVDIARADAAAEAVVRDSALWRVGVSCVATLSASWHYSRTRRILRAAGGARR
jgi:hypothetical protein